MKIINKLGDLLDSLILGPDAMAFENRMRSLGIVGDDAADVRESAILLAQLGVRSDQVESMARVYHLARVYSIDDSDLRAIGNIKHSGFREGFSAGEASQ